MSHFRFQKKHRWLGLSKRKKLYIFCRFEKTVRHFPAHYEFDYIFGDMVDVPQVPSFVKSRPINDENNNSILLKLNTIRHFTKMNMNQKSPYLYFEGWFS
jgi:hypothetical protein